MKAAVFHGPEKLVLEDVPDPTPGPGDLVLRTGANTVCGTDLRILHGQKTAGVVPGVVLGHEIAGYVEAIGDQVTGFSEGDLVSVIPTVPCGQCYYCRRGLDHLCIDAHLFGYDLNGGLADHVLIPEAAIRRGGVAVANPSLSPAEVALAEPLSCVLNGLSHYKPHVGDTALIIGAGPIGLLHLQAVRAAGASQVIVSDPTEARRRTALQLGATDVVDPSQDDLETFVRDHTEGVGADLVVICIGAGPLINEALHCARKQAHVSLFAGFPKGRTAEIDPNLIHYGELTVVGASNSGRAKQDLALRLIGSHAIDTAALVTDTYTLDHVVEAIEYSASGHGIKVAVTP